MMQAILQNQLPALVGLMKAHKVKKAYAFGSVCTYEFNETSDIDLLIEFDEPIYFEGYADNLLELESKLQFLLSRKVDLVPAHTLKNPYFIKVMNKTKTALYE